MATPDEEGRPGGTDGGFSFTRKLGPFPVWVWMIVTLAGAVLYSTWHKNKAAASKTSSTSSTASTTPTDQTPPFIIQNFPGTSGGTGPAGPAGPAGATGATGATGPAGSTTPAPAPSPSPTPPPKPAPVSMPTAHQPLQYRVKPGDTLSKIAEAYHINGGGQALYQFNIGTGPGTANRSAKDIATLKQRGPDLIYSNEVIFIPQ